MTDKGSLSVAETFDLSLIDLTNVFGKVITALPSHSGPYSPPLLMLLQSWLKQVLAQYPVIIATSS